VISTPRTEVEHLTMVTRHVLSRLLLSALLHHNVVLSNSCCGEGGMVRISAFLRECLKHLGLATVHHQRLCHIRVMLGMQSFLVHQPVCLVLQN
jgi:hypothetical protein